MKTEKVLLSTNQNEIYNLELELKRERYAVDELSKIYQEAEYTEGDISFREFILKPLKKSVPNADPEALLNLFGKSNLVERAEQLKAFIKYPNLTTPEAISAHFENNVYDYTKTPAEAEMITFLRATIQRMIDLGISKRSRIELAEVFGLDVNTGDVRTWIFRDQVQKCSERIEWRKANPDAAAL